MLGIRMTTLAFFLLELPPPFLFALDFMSALKLDALGNILMVFGRNIEQGKTTCCIQV